MPPDYNNTITIISTGVFSSKVAASHKKLFYNRKFILERTLLKNNGVLDNSYSNTILAHATINLLLNVMS